MAKGVEKGTEGSPGPGLEPAEGHRPPRRGQGRTSVLRTLGGVTCFPGRR